MMTENKWIEEALAVAADISSCVIQAFPSDVLNSEALQSAYLNIESLESNRITVRVSFEGFAVVGRGAFDDKSLETGTPETYETIYSLLQTFSPAYTSSFAEELKTKLENI